MIKIFIIDDHFLIASGFKEEFSAANDGIEIVGSAIDVLSAMKEIQIRKTDIDIIVLDLFIKFLDPIANYRLLNKNFPLIPITILSHESSPEWQIKMYREGIKGFLLKSDDKRTMCNVFYQVANGSVVIPGDVIKMMGNEVVDKIAITLSPEENELISDLAQGKTLKDIAGLSNRTQSAIEKRIKLIRDKFSVRTNCELMIKLTQMKLI